MAFCILVGDARKRLRALPDNHVHCVVTSPPYWGLRSYQGDPGMIGLEPTFEEHLTNLVAVFREVWRVLRDDGTLWLNYGDAYATSGTRQGGRGSLENPGQLIRYQATPPGFKSKDLLMMPARVAMALQADGWYLRSEIIWHKPNPMPESVTDRPTSAHEKMFLLTKQPRYFYDQTAIRLPPTGRTDTLSFNTSNQDRNDSDGYPLDGMIGANARNVWKIPAYSFKGAHFATFPPKLVEPCIKAGTSERGCCPDCGAPWTRTVGKAVPAAGRGSGNLERKLGAAVGRDTHVGRSIPWNPTTTPTTGWSPSCECDAGKPVPAVVLDPFGGAGTVGMVADYLGRDSVLVEISAEYADTAEKRIRIGNPRTDPTAEPEQQWATLDGWEQ